MPFNPLVSMSRSSASLMTCSFPSLTTTSFSASMRSICFVKQDLVIVTQALFHQIIAYELLGKLRQAVRFVIDDVQDTLRYGFGAYAKVQRGDLLVSQ
jgi:hypothetical protein